MSAPIIRLGSRHKRLAYAAFGLLWASGGLWLVFHYFLASDGDFGPEAHPLGVWWLRLHGLAAMAALVATGSLATHHMPLAWVRRKNLRTGLPMLALTAWLAATGYALYYFSGDDNAAWLPPLHWIAGLPLPAWLAVHVLAGRKRAHPRRTPAQHAGATVAVHVRAERKATGA